MAKRRPDALGSESSPAWPSAQRPAPSLQQRHRCRTRCREALKILKILKLSSSPSGMIPLQAALNNWQVKRMLLKLIYMSRFCLRRVWSAFLTRHFKDVKLYHICIIIYKSYVLASRCFQHAFVPICSHAFQLGSCPMSSSKHWWSPFRTLGNLGNNPLAILLRFPVLRAIVAIPRYQNFGLRPTWKCSLTVWYVRGSVASVIEGGLPGAFLLPGSSPLCRSWRSSKLLECWCKNFSNRPTV